MEIIKSSSAGTLESSDGYVEIFPGQGTEMDLSPAVPGSTAMWQPEMMDRVAGTVRRRDGTIVDEIRQAQPDG